MRTHIFCKGEDAFHVEFFDPDAPSGITGVLSANPLREAQQ
jgi:hypothetical protein